jgi:ADP-heptose:LPS heptosyltransferase
MHLLETYSLVSGARIGQSWIKEKEISLPSKKYITFHPVHSKGNARKYSYWKDVIINLKNNNSFISDYDIIQIGEHDGIDYGANVDYLEKTNYHELAYLIHNASLHLGYDSLAVHLASHFQTKIVAIYSYLAKNSGPYFSKDEDIIILESSYKDIRPSYSYDDNFRLIDKISPKEISDAVLKLLNIDI